MTSWLLLVAWLWPLLLAGTYLPWSSAGKRSGWVPSGLGPWRGALLISSPLPALAAALVLPTGTALSLPWLFLGTELRLDPVARIYLTFTSLLWLAASVYAAFGFRGDVHARRFAALFLLAMAGNLWLIVGRDLPSFYAGFSLMGLASYVLVIHDGSATSLRAGKVYLVMALLGEVSLFAALVMIVHQTGTTTPTPDDLAGLDGLAIGLALVGLGVKAGMVPLHLWLPLAHPAAPIPASAVLSGTMIKAALLGWMRFLPVGAAALPDWGGLLAVMGLVTLFYALPVGLVQSDPKTVLAYSSVSKMGLMMLLLGLVLVDPALAPVGVAAIALYAAHHALVKGGLFLGVGLRKHAPLQPFVLGALVFLALALAGAPFTSGAVAKYATKPIVDATAWPWLAAAIAVGAVGTTLLMGRFLWVSVRTRPHPEPGWLWPGLAWAGLVALAALFPFVLGDPAGLIPNSIAVPVGIVLAGLVAIAALINPPWLRPLIGLLPPGDLVVLARPTGNAITGLWLRLWRPLQAVLLGSANLAKERFIRMSGQAPSDAERVLRAWPVAGGLWIASTALLTWLMLAPQPLRPDGDAAQAEPEPIPGLAPKSVPQPASDPYADTATRAQPKSTPRIVRPSPDVIVLGPENEPASRGGEPGAEPQPPAGPERPAAPTANQRPGAGRAVADASREPTPAAADIEDTRLWRTEPDTPTSQDATAAPDGATQQAETVGASEPPPAPAARAPRGDDVSPGDAPQEPEAEPSPCDPPTPYRFDPAGDGQLLALSRCRDTGDGPAEPIDAPKLSRPLIRAVQQALAARGHDPGSIDGLMGPATRGAIRRLREASGLEPDDAITFETLDLLQQETSGR